MKKIYKLINENGILSSLIASVIFAIVLFFLNNERKSLVYDVFFHEKIIDVEQGKGFEIYDTDSMKVTDNLYLLKLDIWNKGNKPISITDIKEKINFQLDTSAVILNEVVIHENYSNVTNTTILKQSNKIFLNFDYLEKQNAIRLQLYYSNNEKSKVKFNGYIAEGDNIQRISKCPTWVSVLKWIIALTGSFIILTTILSRIRPKFEKELKATNIDFNVLIALISYYGLVGILNSSLLFGSYYLINQILRFLYPLSPFV